MGSTKPAPANSVAVKQRWLFFILVLVLFVISANIGITALILYYINVANNSVGHLHFLADRTYIRGQVIVATSLTSAIIRGNASLHLISQGPVSVRAGDGASFLVSSNSTLMSGSVRMVNSAGHEYLFLSAEEMRASFRHVVLKGKAKALHSLRTASVESQSSNLLRIASPTEGINMTAGGSLTLSSSAGPVEVRAFDRFYVASQSITLNGRELFLPRVALVQPERMNQSAINELCICHGGRVFAAPAAYGCDAAGRSLC